MDKRKSWNYDWLIRRFKRERLKCKYCLNVFIGMFTGDAALYGAGVRLKKRNMLYSHYFCIEDAARFLRNEIARYDRVLAWLTKRQENRKKRKSVI